MELHSHGRLILFEAAPLLFPLPKVQLFTVFQLTSAALSVLTECQKIPGGIVYSGLMHFNCTFSVYIYSLRRNAKAKSASTAAENSYVHFHSITEGFQPSQNIIQKPKVYRLCFIIQLLYSFMLYFSYKIGYLAFFHVPHNLELIE